jgi:translation initiation factor IF-2
MAGERIVAPPDPTTPSDTASLEVNTPAEKPSAPSAEAFELQTELTGPPNKPQETAQSPLPSMINRPTLRRTRAVHPATGASATGDQPSTSKATDESPNKPATITGPQSILEIQRPQQPVRSNLIPKPARRGVERSNEALALETGSISKPQEARSPADLLLSQPAPVRPSKRAKTQQEEEDELQELKGKSGKAGTKVRRQLQEDIEEDEDFETDLNPQVVVDVSQSLMRPPKPKTAKQAKPAGVVSTRATTPQKTKKFTRSSRDRRQQQEDVAERPEKLVLKGDLTVQELASELAVPETDIIKTLFFKGVAANINQTLDVATAKMVAEELEFEVETAEQEAIARKVTEMLDPEDLENLQPRPPVVTIMGHVDHGKTTLLDSIRKTKVAQGEAGGITQHIGAYHVDVEHEGETQQIVFLDTPGHEAFTAMRARGARVTDIAVLVVAADDGVRPQTVEAISHAQAAGVPIIVAINKIDKEGVQPDRVKQELTEYGLVPEEWGGDTIMTPVSAITGENLDTLLEMILLVAEVEDLHANPNRPAKGTVIEAHLDKARGPVATLLVQNGTLEVSSTLVAGSVFGKVRAMVDDQGQRVTAAGPSFAVEVLGLADVPAAGDEFDVFMDEKEARAIAGERISENRQSRLQQTMASRRVSLNALSDQAREGELKELNLVLKADVQGSVEAILGALGQLPQNEVQLRVLLAAPGEITETDVDLATASDAVIIGFNTTLASGARQAADQMGVDVREYNIIYKLLEDIEGAMEGLLEPELVEEALGQAQVRAVFPVGRGAVAGCYVQSGKLVRNCRVRVHRNGSVIHEGILDSLKRVREDAREVNAGYECGVGLDNFQAWVEDDLIEAFRMVTKRRTLSAN